MNRVWAAPVQKIPRTASGEKDPSEHDLGRREGDPFAEKAGEPEEQDRDMDLPEALPARIHGAYYIPFP